MIEELFYWIQNGAPFIAEIVLAEEVMRCCFNAFPQTQSRLIMSWKLCLNYDHADGSKG